MSQYSDAESPPEIWDNPSPRTTAIAASGASKMVTANTRTTHRFRCGGRRWGQSPRPDNRGRQWPYWIQRRGETIVYLISMGFFVIFLLLIDFSWSISWLWLPFVFLIQQILAYGLGLLFAILSVFLRDVKEIVNVGIQFWFWLTPIVYVSSIIPENFRAIFLLNPIYHTTKAYRDILILGQGPDLVVLGSIAMLGVGLLLSGLYLGKYLERDIRDFL